MHTKRNVFIICMLLLSFCLFASSSKAQVYSIKNRLNVKVGYAGYPYLGKNIVNANAFSPVFNLEANYGVLNFLEVGGYMGYSLIKTTSRSTEGYANTGKANVLFYGIRSNIQLLPFFLKSEKFRFDFYLSGKCGGFYRFTNKNENPARGNALDYGFYGGVAFFPGEHWGIFGEYGWGNYVNHQYGLSFKF